MKHEAALKVAESLVGHLRPACVRIEIAGSIRREKFEVKDIEILAIPDLSPLPKPKAEFGKPIPMKYKTALDQLIAKMAADGDIRFGKNGDRLKSFYLGCAGIQVDLFLVLPPATWGVLKVIRTGPADFSHWCVTRKRNGGALPNNFRVQDGAVWEGPLKTKSLIGERLIGFEDETDFLRFLGLDWIEPRDRIARWNT